MAVETAADLAGFFDEEEFAEAAVYAPPGGGSSIPCSVIVDRGQGRTPFMAGERGVQSHERMLWAQASQIVALQRSGVFTMLDDQGVATGEVFRVAGEPKLDQVAALWSAELMIVD